VRFFLVLHSFPTRRSSDLVVLAVPGCSEASKGYHEPGGSFSPSFGSFGVSIWVADNDGKIVATSDSLPPDEIDQKLVWLTNRKRSEEHTSELQSRRDLVCR